jgi:hypothetical protein
LEEKVKQFALSQYLSMLESDNFGEGGRDRTRIDFARHLLKLPASYQISTLDLERFDQLIAEQKPPQVTLAELRDKKNVVIAARKEGFPMVIYGPQRIMEKDEYRIITIEEEIARTPTAVLAIAAFTQQDGTIIIRREAFEHIYYRKWSKLASPEIINEIMELTITHEIAHAVVAKTTKNKSLYILGKMLDAHLPNSTLDALNEAMAEWEPTYGALPYLAKLAQGNYEKARRLLYYYLADANFKGNSDQAFMANYTKLLFDSIKPYIKNQAVIDFVRMLEDAPKIFTAFQNQFEKLVTIAKESIENATFELGDLNTNFETLAAVQHQKFQAQNPTIDPKSDYYQRYFWSNLVKYLKNCAPDDFAGINNQLHTQLKSCYN